LGKHFAAISRVNFWHNLWGISTRIPRGGLVRLRHPHLQFKDRLRRRPPQRCAAPALLVDREMLRRETPHPETDSHRAGLRVKEPKLFARPPLFGVSVNR